MKQFSQAYTLSVILAFNDIENKLKNSDRISQQAVAKLLLPDNELFIFTQQAVALLQNTKNKENTIMQQAVALLNEKENEHVFCNLLCQKFSGRII
jgi:hypothetical protein